MNDNHPVNVGESLRRLRAESGMSMRALAKSSGLSANALSMIERGRTSPSVSTLYKLAEALGVPVTAFFGTPEERQQVIFLRALDRARVPIVGGTWEGLGGEKFSGRVEPFVLSLEAGGGSGPAPMVHTGHEFVFCLSGSIEYQVEGSVTSSHRVTACCLPPTWSITGAMMGRSQPICWSSFPGFPRATIRLPRTSPGRPTKLLRGKIPIPFTRHPVRSAWVHLPWEETASPLFANLCLPSALYPIREITGH